LKKKGFLYEFREESERNNLLLDRKIIGKFYDELFEAQQRGDYFEFVKFEKKQVEEWLDKAKKFVEHVRLLIEK